MTLIVTSEFELNRVVAPRLPTAPLEYEKRYHDQFADILRLGRLPRKPTVYLCAADRAGDVPASALGDAQGEALLLPDAKGTGHMPALLQGGQASGEAVQREAMLLLVNAPADQSRPLGSTAEDYREVAACQTNMLAHLQRCGLKLHFAPHQCRITTPADFHTRFPASGGALYGPAANGWMATFAREQARSPLRGLYLAGGTVHPGPGVPMAAMSGILAAEALMADRALTRQFHPGATFGGTSMPSATMSDTASH